MTHMVEEKSGFWYGLGHHIKSWITEERGTKRLYHVVSLFLGGPSGFGHFTYRLVTHGGRVTFEAAANC